MLRDLLYNTATNTSAFKDQTHLWKPYSNAILDNLSNNNSAQALLLYPDVLCSVLFWLLTMFNIHLYCMSSFHLVLSFILYLSFSLPLCHIWVITPSLHKELTLTLSMALSISLWGVKILCKKMHVMCFTCKNAPYHGIMVLWLRNSPFNSSDSTH